MYCHHCVDRVVERLKTQGIKPTDLMEKENKRFSEIVKEISLKEKIELHDCIYEDSEYSLKKCASCKIFSN